MIKAFTKTNNCIASLLYPIGLHRTYLLLHTMNIQLVAKSTEISAKALKNSIVLIKFYMGSHGPFLTSFVKWRISFVIYI
jgi:hypothetical protein